MNERAKITASHLARQAIVYPPSTSRRICSCRRSRPPAVKRSMERGHPAAGSIGRS